MPSGANSRTHFPLLIEAETKSRPERIHSCAPVIRTKSREMQECHPLINPRKSKKEIMKNANLERAWKEGKVSSYLHDATAAAVRYLRMRALGGGMLVEKIKSIDPLLDPDLFVARVLF